MKSNGTKRRQRIATIVVAIVVIAMVITTVAPMIDVYKRQVFMFACQYGLTRETVAENFSRTGICWSEFADVYKRQEEEISERAEEVCEEFFKRLPYVQQMLLKDVQAGFDGDLSLIHI